MKNKKLRGKKKYEIISDGKITIYKAFDSNGRLCEIGKSSCHPEDKFNLFDGIDYAIQNSKIIS